MDTFFFIQIEITDLETPIRLGPYATYTSAAEIMVDCLPAVLSAELQTTEFPTYTASISEWAAQEHGWDRIGIKVTEQAGY